MAKRGRKPSPPLLTPDQAGAPEKPATIRSDKTASKLWDFLVETLAAQEVLAPTDGPILTALCSAYSRLIRVREILAKESLVVVNEKNGATKAHPLLNVEAGAASEVHRYASELGLSPTARARVQRIETAEKEETLEDLLA